MPNWVTNKIIVKGNLSNVLHFINEGLVDRKIYAIELDTFLANECVTLENEVNSKPQTLTLRSWMPMPQIFRDWDCTNAMRTFEQWENYNVNKNILKTYTYDELKELYQKYVDGWTAAKKEQEETYGCVGWYDYNCMTLGTKWDARLDFEKIEHSGEEVTIEFSCETAWCDPIIWFNTICERYPDVNFYMMSVEEMYSFVSITTSTGIFEEYCPDEIAAKYIAEKFGDDEDVDDERDDIYWNKIADVIDEVNKKFDDIVNGTEE